MYLTHLSLTNFRNYSRLDTDVQRGVVILVGGNAQGKTSVLEAIHFLATFSSFTAGSDRQMINFIAGREPLAVGRIVASFCRQEPHESAPREHRLEVRIIQEERPFESQPRVRKEVLVDGVPSKVSEALGLFNAVVFLPQSTRLIEGTPEERRRYLNQTLAQVVPHYALALSEYNQALTQRNALLKILFERNGDTDQLSYWDEQLAFTGARLIHARIQAIQELEYSAAVSHHELTRGDEVLRLAYEPSYDPVTVPDNQFTLPLDAQVDRADIPLQKIQAGFRERLEQLRRQEIARGVTTIGPHRDELRFFANSIDLGLYGSRGQIRTAVLALKLAEVAWMRAKTNQWPVLLLDEVLAELDTQRRSDLLGRLSASEQAMLTTTDLDQFMPDFVQRASVWQVISGRLVG